MSRHALARPRRVPLAVRVQARARYRRSSARAPWYATRTGSGLDWAASLGLGILLTVGLALPH